MTLPSAIILDMDGTIADLYGVPDWLKSLRASDATPYAIAKPIGNAARINSALAALQAHGVAVQVVSWGPKGATHEYLRETRRAKRLWCAQNFPSIKDVKVVRYGANKWRATRHKGGVLLDDSPEVCARWNADSNQGHAIRVTNRDTVEKYVTMLAASIADK